METITSPTNPRIKRAAKLREPAPRRESGLTLVDGRRELARALAAGVEIAEVFIAADNSGGFESESLEPDLAAMVGSEAAARSLRRGVVMGRKCVHLHFTRTRWEEGG